MGDLGNPVLKTHVPVCRGALFGCGQKNVVVAFGLRAGSKIFAVTLESKGPLGSTRLDLEDQGIVGDNRRSVVLRVNRSQVGRRYRPAYGAGSLRRCHVRVDKHNLVACLNRGRQNVLGIRLRGGSCQRQTAEQRRKHGNHKKQADQAFFHRDPSIGI